MAGRRLYGGEYVIAVLTAPGTTLDEKLKYLIDTEQLHPDTGATEIALAINRSDDLAPFTAWLKRRERWRRVVSFIRRRPP